MKRIESRSNITYKSIAALRQTRNSRETGLVFLEGTRLCSDALQAGAVVETALLSDAGLKQPSCQAVLAMLPGSVEPLLLPDKLFDSLCATEQPQGIALVCRSPLLDRPSGPPPPDALVLIAENIQDPGNLGSMIRTAAAFAFNAVIVIDGTVYPFNEKVLRAAMGSCFHIPLLAMPDVGAVAAWLATAGSQAVIIAADIKGQNNLPTPLPLPAALIVGNEANGLSIAAQKLANLRISIPMPGRAESLNAAAAAAILCCDLMRSRGN